jgi:hypothetical protein
VAANQIEQLVFALHPARHDHPPLSPPPLGA